MPVAFLSHEDMGRAVVSPRDLAPLVEGFRGLAARHDCRVSVRPHRHLAPFERLVLQVARPVLRKPVLLRQDEPARTDASKVRSQDIAQDDDVASNSALRKFSPSFAKSSSTNVVAFVIDSASMLSWDRGYGRSCHVRTRDFECGSLQREGVPCSTEATGAPTPSWRHRPRRVRFR